MEVGEAIVKVMGGSVFALVVPHTEVVGYVNRQHLVYPLHVPDERNHPWLNEDRLFAG
jgi:hypothetical protein